MANLLTHLTGPGLPRPIGRRRTFIEWVLDGIIKMAALGISLTVIFIVATIAIHAFLALAILL